MGVTQQTGPDFLAGVIEGFYGQPWTQPERLALFDWLAAWGLNTYLYAPKDDLKHRATWRERYAPAEADGLGQLIRECQQRKLRFIYALSPGLDIEYGAEADLDLLRQRLEQLMDLGCEDFALLFDDIPDRLSFEALKRWGSLASAQCHVANTALEWVRQRHTHSRFLFCPTPYCGRMAQRQLGGEGYLRTLGRELSLEIDVFWTGPEIVSRDITPAQAREMQEILGRKPLIWDNLHANDYDGRRWFCGPYAGRPPELRAEVSGLLINPNCEFALNYVPVRTLAQFVHGDGSWNPREAFLAAMREWLPEFDTVRGPVALEDLILLGDCYYLPHEEGPEAEALYAAARKLLASDPAGWAERDLLAFRQPATRLRQLCTKLTELRHRPLFYALSRRIWDLREELDLLDGFIQHRATVQDPKAPCHSDFHLPGTFRGGMVSRLQKLLLPKADGTFTATPNANLEVPLVPVSSKTDKPMSPAAIRLARPGDQPGAYYVCLKTGNFGQDGEPFYQEDPDALGRLFVGPYLSYEPDLSFILEDEQGICGYALGAFDSRAFYARYEAEWRPDLCARFPAPQGDPSQWTRVQEVYDWYHHPDYFCPEPYKSYPSHLHIDLLPRAQGRGYGRRMLEAVMEQLERRGSPGAHLGVSTRNQPAIGFYQRLGFQELTRAGSGNSSCIYMGKAL